MRQIELITIKSRFATTESRITVRTAMELRLRLLHPTSIAVAFLLTDHVLLLRGIHGKCAGTWATRKDQGGVAHDSARGHALLRRLKAMGMCPPALSRPSPSSARGQINRVLPQSYLSSRWLGRRVGKLPAGVHG
jgi:hypothetical protein